jgi:hypothetical protein
MRTVAVKITTPFDLGLSLHAAASFMPALGPAPENLRIPAFVGSRPIIIELDQASRTPPVVEARSSANIDSRQIEQVVCWLVSADLNLRLFYRLTAPHPIMSTVVGQLRGLRPLRPASLFEMLVIAITEQQLSMTSAFHIRDRLSKRFGTPVRDLWAFPTPDVIEAASLNDLKACGLSGRKAEYVKNIAKVVAGCVKGSSRRRGFACLPLAASDGLPYVLGRREAWCRPVERA